MGSNIMNSYTCKVCGYTTEAEGDAKFCQQCGASFAEPAPQRSARAGSRMIIGAVIKEHLLAQLLEGGEKKSGRFEVRTDGVIYVTSSRFGNKVIQVPAEDIADVSLGEKDNILVIERKSGGAVLVKMGGASRWVTLIQQVMR